MVRKIVVVLAIVDDGMVLQQWVVISVDLVVLMGNDVAVPPVTAMIDDTMSGFVV